MSIEQAKRTAGFSAVDEYITSGMVVGVGSGSTVVYVVERLIQKVKEGKLLNIICIPTSFQSTQLIIDGGLTLEDLTVYPEIDVAIDGTDEVDSHLNLIKGGGGAQTKEKIIAYNAKKFIIVADYRKETKQLCDHSRSGVPIEVIPIAYVALKKKLEHSPDLFGNKVVATLRMAVKKAGPVVTDNGNFILDVDFGIITNPKDLSIKLSQLPGVVDHGIFVDMAEKAFFGQADGTVTTLDKNGNRTKFSAPE